MRSLTPIEIERLGILTENNVEATLIEPTRTGLEKSIMDATGTVRLFLKEKKLHDYELQEKGPENKVLIQAYLINEREKGSICSLYRPMTKNGDPRIWFKGLAEFAKPNDIIGIIAFQTKIFVINISRTDIGALMKEEAGNALKYFIQNIKSINSAISDELLRKLKGISAKGPIPALLQADTAVGRTLEQLLNLPINSSKKPDYKGIELKSFRESRGNRKTLFAQVPDWSLSKFKSSHEILECFGYARGENFKLYCTVSAINANSQGLQLRVDNQQNRLIEFSKDNSIGDFVVWMLEALHARLLQKHRETFWIEAKSSKIGGHEYFHYTKVEHTQSPIFTQFDILLMQGIITVDHLIKQKSNGGVVEKGPLFKIKPNALNLLFPPSKIYLL